MRAYITLVAFLRVSGKRTLAKLNAFDLVVGGGGSTLSAILLQESVALAEGAVALALLIDMQFLVTFMSVRYDRFARWVRSEPALLVRAGTYCEGALRSEVTNGEALSAIRSAGGADVAQADFVVLESDGTMSVGLMSPPPPSLNGD